MIKYICDICSQEVYELEVLGPGVVQNYPDNPYMGKEYHYVGYVQDQEVEVYVALKSTGKDHFCKACMWVLLKGMIAKYGPKDTPNEETNPGVEGSDSQLSQLYAEGVLPTPGPDERTDDGGSVESDRGVDPNHPGVPNFDPGPTPEAAWAKEQRPGWQFRSTANGI